jgi:hypothetical protein
MIPFTFNSKETYLQYRNIWKQKYAALSQVIRDLKFCRKSQARISKLGQIGRYDRVRKEHSTQFGFDPNGLVQFRFRPMATEMLAELKLAKAEAQRQYLAKHAELVANQ